ncbi:MAG: hypothetical protein KUF74_11125 [Candidatus Thiodiazotropha sp. (ex Ctena orbiculata)]|nr:hypothetical protein [Candidatus Thiodiazotropha taylori]
MAGLNAFGRLNFYGDVLESLHQESPKYLLIERISPISDTGADLDHQWDIKGPEY